MVQKLTSPEDFKSCVKDDKKSHLIVVDFYAEWCGPCRMIAPKIEEMENTYKDVKFYKIDVDDEAMEDLVQECQIQSMPTFMFFKGGDQLEMVLGANKTSIEDAIKKHSSS